MWNVECGMWKIESRKWEKMKTALFNGYLKPRSGCPEEEGYFVSLCLRARSSINGSAHGCPECVQKGN